ncbi:MAG: chromate efflux transporter [FCB group bacterium]|jgi:chromate transporter
MNIGKPTYKEAFLFWLKLGFISFGGPAGQIAIMRDFLVDKKKWISNSKFLHALNYCFLLPGPEAQQLAIYSGWLLHGIKGGLTAGILFVLPSVFVLLGLSITYAVFGKLSWVYAIFDGLKPAVVAIVITALLKITKKSLSHFIHYLIAIASFIAIFIFNINYPYIIIGAIAIGFIIERYYPKLFIHTENLKKNEDETDFFINANSLIPNIGFNLKRLIREVIIFLICWAFPILLFYLYAKDFIFWKTLTLFFTSAAFFTFGGAYAVLPFVAQVSVEKLNWLSKQQMIDGFALGETTPGPLIMVLAFVGFMGGFNYFHGSVLNGTIGLITTTYYTFLPCFLFVLAGAPIIEKTQTNPKLQVVLGIVTAAVVGVILNLTVYFGKAVIFPQVLSLGQIDYSSLIWIVVSFVALYKFKANMLFWIGISSLYGFVHQFLLK